MEDLATCDSSESSTSKLEWVDNVIAEDTTIGLKHYIILMLRLADRKRNGNYREQKAQSWIIIIKKIGLGEFLFATWIWILSNLGSIWQKDFCFCIQNIM